MQTELEIQELLVFPKKVKSQAWQEQGHFDYFESIFYGDLAMLFGWS